MESRENVAERLKGSKKQDSRKKYNEFLQSHIKKIREDASETGSYIFRSAFPGYDVKVVLSNKEYRFVSRVVEFIRGLYKKCEKNKEHPSYWIEATATAAAGVVMGAAAAGGVSGPSAPAKTKTIALLIAMGAAISAKRKKHKTDTLRRSAEAFTLVCPPEKLDNLAVSLGVILAYRLGNIIERLEESQEGVDELANFISAHICSHILGNEYRFGSDHELISSMLAHAIPPAGDPSYKEYLLRRHKKVKQASGKLWPLELLLTKSPAHDEIGTIYYKVRKKKDPFQYPFQRLQNYEEAMRSGYAIGLDVTKCWDSLLKPSLLKPNAVADDDNGLKLHWGSEVFNEIPNVFHSEVLCLKTATIGKEISFQDEFSSSKRNSNSIEKKAEDFLCSLKEYLEFITQVVTPAPDSKFCEKFRDDCFSRARDALRTGETRNIQLFLYIQDATIQADKLLKGVEKGILSSNRKLKRIHDKIMVLHRFMNGTLETYREAYIVHRDRWLATQLLVPGPGPGPAPGPAPIPIPIPFIHADPQFIPPYKPVELSHSAYGSLIAALKYFNPLSVNESANKIMDLLLHEKRTNLRFIGKLVGGVTILVVCGTAAIWLIPAAGIVGAGAVTGLGACFFINTSAMCTDKYFKRCQEIDGEILKNELTYLDDIERIEEEEEEDNSAPEAERHDLQNPPALVFSVAAQQAAQMSPSVSDVVTDSVVGENQSSPKSTRPSPRKRAEEP